VKVLDFGLAKALDQGSGIGEQGSVGPANSPTITTPAMTMRGVILGTAAYMAPEQAKGKAVDKRADIWAFGVVVYEMLTGRRAFDGETMTDVIAAVVTREPDWTALPAATPERVRGLLRRCLKKDPRPRLRDIGEARVLLDELITGTAADVAEVASARSSRRTVVIAVAAALVLAAITGVAVWRSAPPARLEVRRFSITPAPDTPISVEQNHLDVAVSPDGARMAYVSRTDTSQQIVLRPLDRFETTLVQGAPDRLRSVSFTSDGTALLSQGGLGADAALYKIPVAGGSSSRLAALTNNLRGAATLGSDAVVFATIDRQTGLMQVPATGGEPEVLTIPATGDGELDHLWPSVLPGGRHLLFSILRDKEQFDVGLLTLDTRQWRVLIKDGTSARYSASGHIVFGSRGVLKAVPFDTERLELSGDIATVVDGVVTKSSGAVSYSLSDTGTLVYMPGRDRSSGLQLAWVRMADGQTEPSTLPQANFVTVQISPDGHTAAAVVGTEDPRATPNFTSGPELWLVELNRGVTSPLVRAPEGLSYPAWSNDGRRIAYYRFPRPDVKDPGGMFVVSTSGTEAPTRVTTAPDGVEHAPGSWTRDGRSILFTATNRRDASEILQVSTETGKVTPVIAGAIPASAPALSPDGQWLAYREESFARGQLFIRPFPDVGDLKIAVSADPSSGLSRISWAADGRTLYYFTSGGGLSVQARSVSVTAAKGGVSISRPVDVVPPGDFPNGMSFPPIDGRLLARRPVVDPPPTEYRVILNWTEELKALAPRR
jgi:eukaryotic-like serine/threonine-protein kinase